MYTPTPVQQEFHSSKCFEVLFGGAAGPGKTESLLWDKLALLQQEHLRWSNDDTKTFKSTCRILHVRRTFPMLEENIDRFSAILIQVFGRKGFKYDGDTHTFTLLSGAKVVFGHMKDENSWQNYVGTQWVRVYWDELTQFEQKQYDMVLTRIRSADSMLRPWLGSRAATNPEAGWVRDHFVKEAPEGRKILRRDLLLTDGTTQTLDRIFIPAKLADHPDPEFRRDYETKLSRQPKHIRDALINGNWWVSADAYYADSWIPSVHVCKPFKIPPTWPRFRACDWGFRVQGAMGWFAIDPNDTIILYREWMFAGLDWTQVVDEIRDIELADGVWDKKRNCSLLCGPLDTQAWEERGHIGPSMAVGMMSRGVPWVKANKGRRLAAQEIVRRLRHRNKDGSPGFIVFDTCRTLIETLPQLKVDERDKEVPEKGGDDHAYDMVSYGLQARYTYKSLEPPIVKSINDDPDEREDKKSRLYDSRGHVITMGNKWKKAN